MIYSNNTYDITADISTYTRRDFKQVFDTTLSKWYMLNNLNEYEEYGIYGDSFDTYYQGKLVIVNDHEYEWDGTEWDDLGEYIEQVVAVYRDANNNGYITFPYTTSEVSSVEATYKLTSDDGNFMIGSGTTDNNDWRFMFVRNYMTGVFYDCGSGRIISQLGNWSDYYNIKRHIRYDGNPMRVYDCDTQTYLYTGSTTRPTGRNIYWGCSEMDGPNPNNGFGYVYDVVLYSDNGETPIAHYIPYVQNNVAGLYDTMSNIFVAPTTGTIGAENGRVRPKDYPTKSAPTITNVWPSKWYHNSTYMYKLMRNDAEQVKLDYMSDDKFKKVL